MSMIASRKAAKHANWKQIENTAINIGSSRGATALFEKYHKHYLQSNKRLSPDPTTYYTTQPFVMKHSTFCYENTA